MANPLQPLSPPSPITVPCQPSHSHRQTATDAEQANNFIRLQPFQIPLPCSPSERPTDSPTVHSFQRSHGTRASRCSRQGISFRFRYRHDRGRPYGESINLSVFVFIPRAPRCARQFPIRLSPPIFQKNRRGGIKHVTESTKLIRLIVQFYCILNRITQESFFVNDSHASACKIT